MIDIASEQLITMTQASHLLPTRPSTSALWRWRTRGVRGVRLETALIGGRRVTSVEALQRFVAATSGDDATAAIATTPSRREAEIRAAESELDDEGVTVESTPAIERPSRHRH